MAELKRSGKVGAGLTAQFSRLFKLKPKSQYQPASVGAVDAGKAVEWAAKMVEGARSIATE